MLAPFLTIRLTALALAPAGTHLLELPSKFGLPDRQSFVVQSIYRGWAPLGIALFGVPAANVALAILLRHVTLAALTMSSLPQSKSTNWSTVSSACRMIERSVLGCRSRL